MQAATGLAASSLCAWPRPAHAVIEPATVTEIYPGARGVTLYLEMRHGPFPCDGESYDNAETIVYVPYHYRLPADERIDTVVHFHGHRTTARDAMADHQLREQLLDSLQNAILVMPQGPVEAEDSSGGNLDGPDGLLDFLTEVRKTLQLSEVMTACGDAAVSATARIGALCISAHSGGYRVTANCLLHGGYNVNEVYLFDALYGQLDIFEEWIVARADQSHSRERHKLISYFNDEGGSVRRNNNRLMERLDEAGIDYVHEEPDELLTRGEMTRARVVFIETGQSHQALTFTHNNLRDCLYSSCLHREIDSTWFDDTESERAIDVREDSD